MSDHKRYTTAKRVSDRIGISVGYIALSLGFSRSSLNIEMKDGRDSKIDTTLHRVSQTLDDPETMSKLQELSESIPPYKKPILAALLLKSLR